MTALLVLAAGCDAVEPLTDAEKKARIASVYEGYRDDFPGVPDVTVDELLALDKETVVLVDVREPEEQEVSMIPGAVSREAYEAGPSAWAGRRVITYCTVGYRSGLYAAELRQRGVDASNLAGSLLAWSHAGQPLVNADGETRRLHVFGAPWNLTAEGYEAVW